MDTFNIKGKEVPFTKVFLNFSEHVCEDAVDLSDNSWDILQNIEWDENKVWDSEEEIWNFVWADYYTKAACIYGEWRVCLVDKQIDDNYGLGKIFLAIDGEKGDLNYLFGFNYDMGEFDPECDKIFNLSQYDITYDDIIAALKNDYQDEFNSLDDFVDYVEKASKPTIKSLFYKHLINGERDVVTRITEFLTDVINESVVDNIDLSLEEHDRLLAFRDEWRAVVNKLDK